MLFRLTSAALHRPVHLLRVRVDQQTNGQVHFAVSRFRQFKFIKDFLQKKSYNYIASVY